MSDRKIVPFRSPLVPMLVVVDANIVERTKHLTETVSSICKSQEQELALVRMSHTVTLQPFAETLLLVVSSMRHPIQVDAFAVFEQNYPCELAREIMDISPPSFLRTDS